MVIVKATDLVRTTSYSVADLGTEKRGAVDDLVRKNIQQSQATKLIYYVRKFRNLMKTYIKKRKKIDRESSGTGEIGSPMLSPRDSLNLSDNSISLDLSLESPRTSGTYNISQEKNTEISNILRSLQDLAIVYGNLQTLIRIVKHDEKDTIEYHMYIVEEEQQEEQNSVQIGVKEAMTSNIVTKTSEEVEQKVIWTRVMPVVALILLLVLLILIF